MAVNLRERAKKPLNLVCKSFTFDETVGSDGVVTPILRVTLVEKIEARRSILSEGRVIPAYDDTINIVGDVDIEDFELNSEENADGTITYTGHMKLDVSEPKVFNGVMSPARIFLTGENFAARSKRMRADYAETKRMMINDYIKEMNGQMSSGLTSKAASVTEGA